MARPEKVRLISELPKYDTFFCRADKRQEKEKSNMILLAVEEYEVIKWMDYYDNTQEECAKKMGVSRGTIQVLYTQARKKIARYMVEGMTLHISGGNYEVCENRCCCKKERETSSPRKDQFKNGGVNKMKIAVTYENGQVFQHFGHTENFKVYEVENGQILSSQVVGTNGQGHGALAGFLLSAGIDVLICGGIGGGARNALAEAGIQLYPGAHGDADEQVRSFIAGSLQYDPNTKCNHHSHEEGHSCGEHGCH